MSSHKHKPPKRVPVPSVEQYSAVSQTQSPRSTSRTYYNSHLSPRRVPSGSGSQPRTENRGAITQGVATGAIGGGYGPYSYNPNGYPSTPTRFSQATSSRHAHREKPAAQPTTSVPFIYDTKDPDLDDLLHNPDPVRDAKLDRSFTIFSMRGWANAIALIVIVTGLLVLFAGFPIITYYQRKQLVSSGYFNLGGINASGQIPDLNIPQLIDPDTPKEALKRKGWDGKNYHLVFSDEFNVDGRTFWPGDDGFWEAENFHYWPTGDLEWYDPQAITTENGKLVITLEMMPINNLNFRSGMINTWNKLCFNTGYIEVSVSMPGSPKAPGLWPGAWTMGNLGRAGYGATTEGMWPFSYDSCDVGTFPNQTNRNQEPQAVTTGSPGGGPLSYLPGQRLSACTCPGSDHPGPKPNYGRGVPEIDIIETQVDVSVFRGEVSQSYQVAPFNYKYDYTNTTPATTIHTPDKTKPNTYKGGVFQQALSAVTLIDDNNYDDQGYATYGYEYWSNPRKRDEGYITWYSEGQPTWTITAASLAGDPDTQISSRLISEEPMYIVLNLGLSPSFQKQDYMHLKFPSKMYIDYVRIYQRDGVKDALTCDPPERPTAEYIKNHLEAYTNPNRTTWDQAGYLFPRNSLYDGCQ